MKKGILTKMENSKYLLKNTIVGNHYQVIDILGEDDFEILYLVKNTHREKSFFVLKELFLETFSMRNGTKVETTPQALGVFEKRKQQIKEETQSIKEKNIRDEIKVYGSFEENNTIYTCMTYTPNIKIETYLQFQPKENINLPLLEQFSANKPSKQYRYLILSILTLITIGIGLFIFFNKDKSNFNIFKNTEVNTTVETKKEFNKTKEILKMPILLNKKKPSSQEENKSSLWRNNFSLVEITEPTIKKEIQEQNISKTVNKPKTISSPSIEEKKEVVDSFNKQAINEFLKQFIYLSSHNNSEKLISLYDTKVDRYFKFKNITSQKVKKSIDTYNRRWPKRDFKLTNFKILKKYKKHNIDYCDVETDTKWKISNKEGKVLSSKSKGLMTLINIENKLKIKSIYSIK